MTAQPPDPGAYPPAPPPGHAPTQPFAVPGPFPPAPGSPAGAFGSPPQQPGPYPEPPYSGPPVIISGPPDTTPPPTAPAPPVPSPGAAPNRRGAGLALAVAVAALVVALVSGVLAVYAIGQAQGAKQTATPAGAQQTSAGQPPANPTAAAPPPPASTGRGPAPTATKSPGQIDPKANFPSAYQPQQRLILRPSGCTEINVDLDEPRVGGGNPDLHFRGVCSSPAAFILPNAVTGSLANSPDVTPNDCAESIRTGPLPGRSTVPATKDLVLCILTDAGSAVGQGITQKLAVVQVRSINQQDGSVEILVSAWNVPG